MCTNVSYFKDKGDSNSSAGWKVSPTFKLGKVPSSQKTQTFFENCHFYEWRAKKRNIVNFYKARLIKIAKKQRSLQLQTGIYFVSEQTHFALCVLVGICSVDGVFSPLLQHSVLY
jgi:hypothetical protein